MATEQQQSTVLASPREPRQASPHLQEPGAPGPSQQVEFRGFDFFAQRDFNEYKDASRAYFAGKNGNPSSWLGDATPPASAHPSLDESRPEEIPQPSNEREQKNAKTILGLRRPWFWTILAIIIVIVFVAVGVGVGSASGADSASDTTNTNTNIPATGMETATTSPPSTSTHITTTSTQRPMPTQEVKTSCPKVNGTVYEVPGSTKKFLQLCGIDYGKEDGAIDLRNVYTDTAEDCINNCAGTKGCTGCGWGFINGDHGPPFRCWLKSKVEGRPHDANTTWHFSVLL
ncbi:hypothetical protein F5B22DRAFT_633682 [Xylaria bambusicola]|uniref:uncharacterized protein n=1 Tax=Xylaria bambusicola TaxID=326684 RepID=UPI00200725B1|nr:uncharacterized protein F5B22DRAFT_633682 [Xylaria bambusicola]KAI0525608.1 hypothetical protein F5B22DRAFT_633682 [Xylaria bambusicola]